MKKIIEVQNLVKDYKDVHAVRDISFSVDEGSFFAFLGVNGAGKSTTINILCTVLKKTSGIVKIGGYDLDTQKSKIKDLIGIVFQIFRHGNFQSMYKLFIFRIFNVFRSLCDMIKYIICTV